MGKPVLVAYATKYGATAEIAEKIGEALRREGLSAEVRPADRVDDLSIFRAVVLGSAVYIGQWRKEARKFLKANEEELGGKPVWLFSSGPTGEGDPVKLGQGWRFPKNLQSVADHIGPRDVTLFHGASHPDKMSGIERWMIKQVKASAGDYRDWEAIAAWAMGIASELKEEGSA